MKPLLNCPYCGSYLKECKQNNNWHEKYCPGRCIMEYHQFFLGDFTSDKLEYVKFDTKDFNVYVYFEDGWYHNLSLIYSKKELNERGKAGPVLKIPTEKMGIGFLEAIESNGRFNNVGVRSWMNKLNDKFKLYVLFS